jgi:hypothetical protein
MRRTARALGATACALAIGFGAVRHLPRNLGHFDGEEEIRALIAPTAALPLRAVYTYNTLPYAVRYYARAEVVALVEREEDLADAAALERAGMPAPARLARDLPATVRSLPRPFALLLPRARRRLLEGGPRPRAASTHYLLFVEE